MYVLLLKFNFIPYSSLKIHSSEFIYSTQNCTWAEYNSLPAPRAGNLGRTPRDDNRDDVFNCHEVPIKEYLREWNFFSFHLFVFAEIHSHKRIP